MAAIIIRTMVEIKDIISTSTKINLFKLFHRHNRRLLCRRSWYHFSRLKLFTLFVITFISLIPSVLSDDASRQRKSAISDSGQTDFECTDANTYLYHVLSQSKTVRSLNTESSDGNSDRHHPAIPRRAINGDHLKVCSQGFTCCTEEMESRLLGESKKEFQKSVQDKIVGLSHTFDSRTSKFDRFFRELISNARRDLHSMFLRTYGLLYEQNSDIFAALFDNLTNYYGTGPLATISGANLRTSSNVGSSSLKVNLSRAIDSFYNTLYQRMFRILNQPYDFEPRYWQCMSGQMERLKPFGDVPANMKQQVQKAFIAARTFVQGLAAGRDVVIKMMELSPSNECTSGLMRMFYCPHCRGLSNVKPCANFCLNVVKECLSYQADFDISWNDYLDALLRLLTRLEGPFNIETVIDPIDVKISEAIMIFQDKGKEISDQIFSECGAPRVGPRPPQQTRKRSRRESQSSNMNVQSTNQRNLPSRNSGDKGRTRQRQPQRQRQFSGSANGGISPQPNQQYAASVRPTTATGTSLDRLARDLREKVRPAKGFWRHLPYTLCNDDKIPVASVSNAGGSNVEKDTSNCWNGLSKDRHDTAAIDERKVDNPEVPANFSRFSNSAISDLLSKLRTATAAMKKAYNGQEPSWRYSVSAPIVDSVSVLKKSIQSTTSPPRTQKPFRMSADLIGPAIRDGSGDIYDDTEKSVKRPGGVKAPANTDDEDLTDGSGSGDDEISPPPTVVTTTVPQSATIRGKAILTKFDGRPRLSTRRPVDFVGEHPGDFEDIDLGNAGIFEKTTGSPWISSEDVDGNTFEPVTSTSDHSENSEEDDYEDYSKASSEDYSDISTTTTVSTLSIVSTSASSISPTKALKVMDITQPIEATMSSVRHDMHTQSSRITSKRPLILTTRKAIPKQTGSAMAITTPNRTLYVLTYFPFVLHLLWRWLAR